MDLRDAVDMLAPSRVGELGPSEWADLGSGGGTFTLALAEVLAPGSRIHAVDRERRGLRSLPALHGSARIATHHADFTRQPWTLPRLDGILMANSLHYVADQPAFIRTCQAQLNPPGRFLIVEYDTNAANQWVPYPIGRATLSALFRAAGYTSVRVLRTRPSVYRRAALYSAAIGFDE